MSVITITLTDDADLDSGIFSSLLNVEDSKADDGFITAAHVTGVYLMQFMKTPEFQKQVWAFAQEIAGNPGCSIANENLRPSGDAGIGEIEAA